MDLGKVAVFGAFFYQSAKQVLCYRKVTDDMKARGSRLYVLKGKLLLVHGISDVNATLSATIKMVDELVQAGKPLDLIVFPESTHGLTGRAREYCLDVAGDIFVEHLA